MKIEPKLTLDQHYEKCLKELKSNDVLLKYYSQEQVFKLIFNGKTFQLLTKYEKKSKETDWNSVVKEVAVFDSINKFWRYLTSDSKWLQKFKPVRLNNITNKLISKSIIEHLNAFSMGSFELEDYRLFLKWTKSVESDLIDHSEYKQFCSNCKKTVHNNARYSQYICRACVDHLTDESGTPIEFYNTELIGRGCQGYYKNTKPKEKYNSNLGYINNKIYFAKEAYFGGIVIQLKN